MRRAAKQRTGAAQRRSGAAAQRRGGASARAVAAAAAARTQHPQHRVDPDATVTLREHWIYPLQSAVLQCVECPMQAGAAGKLMQTTTKIMRSCVHSLRKSVHPRPPHCMWDVESALPLPFTLVQGSCLAPVCGKWLCRPRSSNFVGFYARIWVTIDACLFMNVVLVM